MVFLKAISRLQKLAPRKAGRKKPQKASKKGDISTETQMRRTGHGEIQFNVNA